MQEYEITLRIHLSNESLAAGLARRIDEIVNLLFKLNANPCQLERIKYTETREKVDQYASS